MENQRRSRKSKPTVSATKQIDTGVGGDYFGATIIVALAILTVVFCVIGLLNSI